MKQRSLMATLLLVTGCATKTPRPAPVAPIPPPISPAVSATVLEDHAGDSTDTAVEVPGDAPDGGVTFENEWIFDRFGRFRRRGGGTGVLNGRRYNIVKIELANGDERTVYFDITKNWNNWKPASK